MIKNRPTAAGVLTDAVNGRSAVIRFDCDQILRAICFHLIDDGHARCVSDQSVRQTRDRLTRQHAHFSVARRQWEAMSNRERLEYLLGQSKTATVYAGQTVNLEPQN